MYGSERRARHQRMVAQVGGKLRGDDLVSAHRKMTVARKVQGCARRPGPPVVVAQHGIEVDVLDPVLVAMSPDFARRPIEVVERLVARIRLEEPGARIRLDRGPVGEQRNDQFGSRLADLGIEGGQQFPGLLVGGKRLTLNAEDTAKLAS